MSPPSGQVPRRARAHGHGLGLTGERDTPASEGLGCYVFCSLGQRCEFWFMAPVTCWQKPQGSCPSVPFPQTEGKCLSQADDQALGSLDLGRQLQTTMDRKEEEPIPPGGALAGSVGWQPAGIRLRPRWWLLKGQRPGSWRIDSCASLFPDPPEVQRRAEHGYPESCTGTLEPLPPLGCLVTSSLSRGPLRRGLGGAHWPGGVWCWECCEHIR